MLKKVRGWYKPNNKKGNRQQKCISRKINLVLKNKFPALEVDLLLILPQQLPGLQEQVLDTDAIHPLQVQNKFKQTKGQP